jgi:signal transduction histidine kinase
MSQPNATLLLVDDDAMNRDALARRLTRSGYNVLTAESGSVALRIVRERRVDAVLLDVMMPGISGIETLRQLREIRSVADLPVIMVTAKDQSEDIVEALDLGANDYVSKPIDFAVALARIRAQVTTRRADPLTGLPNRVLFLDRLNRMLTTQAAGGAPFAVLFLDVDRFKIMACVRGTRELREIAVHTAILEQANRDSARNTIEQGELIARLRLTQQQVEAATRAKSEFVANMSHELRTPLNAITLYSELLQEIAIDDNRPDDVADLGKIQTASRHLLGLINGILDLSKIEAGKMELHLESFGVRPMVEELIGTMSAVVRNNNNTLSVHFENDPQVMHADLTKTRQILFNLLSNAAKFTTNGSVSVGVARRTAGGIERIEFAVTDSGIGLTEEQQRRLFRPFAQGDASISRKYGGTGLGLALVWRFCQLMGGEVTVKSTIGNGATFTVHLPATVRAAGETATATAPEAAA